MAAITTSKRFASHCVRLIPARLSRLLTIMITYQIKDWNENFENSKSRERDRCSFVCVPNKQHGMSFSRIMAEKDGSTIYGVWHLILGACSQQKKPRNGWLTSDGYQTGTAWVPEDLALKFRRPVQEIKRALEVLTLPQVGWIITYEYSNSTRSVPVNCPSGIVKEEKERIEVKEDASITKDSNAIEVLRYLNMKTGKTFQNVESNIKMINARIKDGATLDDLKRVVDVKCKKWLSDPKMSEYLRPATLFNAEKFAQYSGESLTPLNSKAPPSMAEIEALNRK